MTRCYAAPPSTPNNGAKIRWFTFSGDMMKWDLVWLFGSALCGENVCRFQEKQKLLGMSGNVCCMILINMISPAMTALYSVL